MERALGDGFDNAYPITSYAFPGAIFFTSSNKADSSGSHGLCFTSALNYKA